jgi:hypothetical protein
MYHLWLIREVSSTSCEVTSRLKLTGSNASGMKVVSLNHQRLHACDLRAVRGDITDLRRGAHRCEGFSRARLTSECAPLPRRPRADDPLRGGGNREETP